MNRLLEQANGDLEKQAAIRAAAAKQAAAVDALARAQTEPGTRIRSFIGEAERSLKDYEGMAIRVSQSVGDAVGNSLANGISGLIEGTTTIKDIFADLLKDLGRILLQEATKMIATYIAIGIAKMFAFGGSSAHASSFEMPGQAFIPAGGFGFPGAAKGAYFSNGVAAFANGGMFTNSVVSSPTLFQFADGGVTRTGLMGEAGPEAIMPLKRGADGKLGVTIADTRAALAEQSAARSTNDTRAMLEQQTAARQANATGMALQQKPIDVRYESTIINQTEYVSAEQHRKGMAEAAERGRALTLAALQNSTRTRKKVGI